MRKYDSVMEDGEISSERLRNMKSLSNTVSKDFGLMAAYYVNDCTSFRFWNCGFNIRSWWSVVPRVFILNPFGFVWTYSTADYLS